MAKKTKKTAADAYLNQWEIEQKNREAQSLKELKTLLDTEVKPLMEKANIKEMTWSYSGSGDSGEVYDNCNEAIDIPEGVKDTIVDHIYNLLPGGWEINEGSIGQFVYNSKTGKMYLDHQEYVPQSRKIKLD